MFIPQEFIRKKRDGKLLGKEEIEEFVTGVTDSSVSNEQISAFAMAVYFNGMSVEEKTHLTIAMKNSGNTLKWDNLNGPVIDKHSTGGVGDTVSLMLGPMLAACGAYVPMISGRGLGHTGGTLDKFESIPGYNVLPDDELFGKVVRECGVAIIGQTESLAPADRRIYAVRDVTATVESIPLITASILSKKLAEGLDVLVMDVKAGSGAFMPSYELSKELAESIVDTANSAGVRTRALITDMDQPLAYNAGNALEVKEAVEYLSGIRRNPRLHTVNLALCTEALMLGGLARDEGEAQKKLENALDSGRALEIFGKMVSMLGGPDDFAKRYDEYLPKAPIVEPIYAPKSGIVESIDTTAVGMCVVALGGGRLRPNDEIDHSVGLEDIVALGTYVDSKTPLAIVHAKDRASFDEAKRRLLSAIHIGDNVPETKEIYEVIG